MKPWQIDGELHGYAWNHDGSDLRCVKRGAKGFGYEMDLLTLKSSNLPVDTLEVRDFKQIDDRGAKIRDKLLVEGVKSLTVSDSMSFARLLMSLEARRPSVVSELRANGDSLRNELDADDELIEKLGLKTEDGSPSEFYERETGEFLEDRALQVCTSLSNEPHIGESLINGCWGVVHVDTSAGNFVLSDRPLIRYGSTDTDAFTWVLPLTPYAVFVATAKEWQSRVTDQRLVKMINKDSASRADKYVFSTLASDQKWIKKYLRKNAI